MIVFDADGTLIGGEVVDWKCFDDAFEEAAGFPFPEGFFEDLEEVTARAIVQKALEQRNIHPEKHRDLEEKTLSGFTKRLRAAVCEDGDSFPVHDGVKELWAELEKRSIPFAVATGDWTESIQIKLDAAGLWFEGLPLVTSSHFHKRADIIRHAIETSGGELGKSIYIGDGVWDLRATWELGIPFIGCGIRQESLRKEGAKHLVSDLYPATILPLFEKLI